MGRPPRIVQPDTDIPLQKVELINHRRQLLLDHVLMLPEGLQFLVEEKPDPVGVKERIKNNTYKLQQQ